MWIYYLSRMLMNRTKEELQSLCDSAHLCLTVSLSLPFSICPLTEQPLCSYTELISLNASLCIKGLRCVSGDGRAFQSHRYLRVLSWALSALDSTWPNEIIFDLPRFKSGLRSAVHLVYFKWAVSFWLYWLNIMLHQLRT